MPGTIARKTRPASIAGRRDRAGAAAVGRLPTGDTSLVAGELPDLEAAALLASELPDLVTAELARWLLEPASTVLVLPGPDARCSPTLLPEDPELPEAGLANPE